MRTNIHIRISNALLAALLLFAPLALAEPGERTYAVELAPASLSRAADVLRDLAETHGAVVVSGELPGDRLLIRTTEPRAIAITADPRVRGLTPTDTSAPSLSVNRPMAVAANAITWGTGVAYQYDGAGNIKQIGTDSFVYDHAGRLVQGDTSGIRRNFTYDAFGNRTNCIQAQGTSVESNCQGGWTVASANNRISGATYDAAGNVTSFRGHTYSYDALNMLTQDVSPFAVREFIYAPGGERIAVHTVGESWRWTVRDTSGKVLREFVSDATGKAGWKWTKDYVWRDGLLLATRQIEPGKTTPTTYHYHLDHLGTPRRITDANDTIVGVHDYHPFGPELSGGINEPSLTALKYTGHERDTVSYDPVSLDYMHARYSDPEMGRFLSVDPAASSAKRTMPQSWNRYAYTLNNPLKYIDPDGTDVYIVVTNTVVGDTRVNSRPGGKGVSETVPAYKIVMMSDAGHVDTFAGSRDTNYSGSTMNTRGEYGTNHEAPPGRFFGSVRTDGKLGPRVELSDEAGGNTVTAPDGTARTNIQIHVGPGCSQGCVLLTGGKENRNAFMNSLRFMQEEERAAERSDQIHVVIQPRNTQECSGDRCELNQR